MNAWTDLQRKRIVREQRRRIAVLEDLLAEARAALVPFARAAEGLADGAPGWAHDGFPFDLVDGHGFRVSSVSVTFGDLERAARAARASAD